MSNQPFITFPEIFTVKNTEAQDGQELSQLEALNSFQQFRTISNFIDDDQSPSRIDSDALDYTKSFGDIKDIQMDKQSQGIEFELKKIIDEMNYDIEKLKSQNKLLLKENTELEIKLQIQKRDNDQSKQLFEQEIKDLNYQNDQLKKQIQEGNQEKTTYNYDQQLKDLNQQVGQLQQQLQVSDAANQRLRNQMKDLFQRQRQTSDEYQNLHTELMNTKLELYEMKSRVITQEKSFSRQLEKQEKEIQRQQSTILETSLSVTNERLSFYDQRTADTHQIYPKLFQEQISQNPIISGPSTRRIKENIIDGTCNQFKLSSPSTPSQQKIYSESYSPATVPFLTQEQISSFNPKYKQ